MVDQEARSLLDYDKAREDIVSLSEAINYAAITGRIEQTVHMSRTLVQLVHACTDGSAVVFTTVAMDELLGRDIARSVAASVYMSKLRYESWVQEDSKNDN